MNWQKGLKGKVKFREPLKDKTTFKIGGFAQYFIEPRDLTDLKFLVRVSKKEKLALLVLGAGSNLLIDDKEIKAIVIRLNEPFFKKISFKKNLMQAGSGLRLPRILGSIKKHSLSGLEFLAGIPGTVGGALVMNAGAWGASIGDLVEDVEVMDYNGRIKKIHKNNLKFGYRSSNFSRYIILSATFKLERGKGYQIREKIKKYLQLRREAQDSAFPGAGSIFKNPKINSAGKLIDLCGLKGRRAGGAFISGKHANFILNKNKASFKDVLKLMSLINEKVKKKFKINLKPEIKIWN